MGCLFGKLFGRPGRHGVIRSQMGAGDSAEVEDEPKYSWEKRERIDPKDFTFAGLNGEEVGRLPGTVNGQQFVINNCTDCCIYLFDHIDTITIDDCKNCKFFIGPIHSSLFIRDCENCSLIVACQQFRTRDCHKLDVMLCCTTQPIVEATSGIKFTCFSYYYPQLDGQFRSAGLCMYDNRWSSIHDFTPTNESKNYSFMAEDVRVEDVVPLPKSEKFASMDIGTLASQSVVPVTYGNRQKPSSEGCLVVIFNSLRMEDETRALFDFFRDNQPDVKVIQTKQVTLSDSDAVRIFNSDQYNGVVASGAVIGIELCGNGCIAAAQRFVRETRSLSESQAFVSADSTNAAQQIENFYNYADLQMAV